jgi:hypothetical protein
MTPLLLGQHLRHLRHKLVYLLLYLGSKSLPFCFGHGKGAAGGTENSG